MASPAAASAASIGPPNWRENPAMSSAGDFTSARYALGEEKAGERRTASIIAPMLPWLWRKASTTGARSTSVGFGYTKKLHIRPARYLGVAGFARMAEITSPM